MLASRDVAYRIAIWIAYNMLQVQRIDCIRCCRNHVVSLKVKLKMFLLKFFLFPFSRYISCRLIIVYYFGQQPTLRHSPASLLTRFVLVIKSVPSIQHTYVAIHFEMHFQVRSFFVDARAHHCSDIVHYALFFHLPMSFELYVQPLRQSVQKRSYLNHIAQVMSQSIALFGGPVLASSAQGLLSHISLKYKPVRANPNTGRVFHACHRMISASAVVLGFGLQEHLEDTSWPFNSSLQAVPSVCKMRLKLIIIKQERKQHGKKRKCAYTLLGVFYMCLWPNRIRSDIKSFSTIVSFMDD